MGQIDVAVAALGSTAKAFWKLAEAAGASSCADTVGSHPLTPAAGITLGSTGVLAGGGDADTSAYANGGSTGYLSSTWASGDIPTTVTVFMVVNPNASVPALHETGVALYLASGTRFGMYIKRNASPYNMATWNSSGSQWLECDTAAGPIARSTVSTLAWTHTGTQLKFYVNGVLQATKTSNALASTYTQVLVAGSQPTGSDPYRGNIAAVLLASPLTDTQIADLHAAATTTAGDTTAPSVPTSLAVPSVFVGGAKATWTASSDDTAVTGYQVAVDGTPIGTTTGTAKGIAGLRPGTTHTVKVRAFDAAGNYSAYTSEVSFTTVELHGPISALFQDDPILVAHRGGANLYPAETMTAYQQANNDTPVVLEGDVHLGVSGGSYTTEYNRMVLLHSPDMGDDGILENDGVTACTHNIFSTTVTNFLLHKMPWPTSGTPVLTARWADLFTHLVANNQASLIEPKHTAAQTAILNAAAVQINGHYLREYLLHNSFNWDQCVAAAAAGLATQWVVSTFGAHTIEEIIQAGIHSVAFAAGASGWATFVSDAHAAGLKAYVWTVESQSQANTYNAAGIDGIIADDPTITLASASNTAPLANAGPDQTVAIGATVTLDGTASSDSDGTIASYQWSQTAGTTVSLSSTTAAQPTFTAPSGACTFRLVVTDNDGATSYDFVTITGSSNTAPTANAGPDQTNIEPRATVTLDGTGSTDPDGTIAAYAWTQTAGTTVTLSSSAAAQPTFTAPLTLAGETLTFSLVVTDNVGATSSPDTVDITVLPASAAAWNGAAWQPRQEVRWDGTAWV